MIRIGILSGDASTTESIKLVQQFKAFKVTGIAQNVDKLSSANQRYTTEELIHNSDAIYMNCSKPTAELIQLVIKKSNHLFLSNLPTTTLHETKQLINLVNEAGSTIVMFNPLTFLTESLKLKDSLAPLKLIHARQQLNPPIAEKQLMDLLLYLASIEKCEVKKIDVFVIEGEHQSNLVNLRLFFSSGSVAQIELGEMFAPSQSLIEIFQKNKKQVTIPLNYNKRHKMTSERNALQHFIESILDNGNTLLSFNELEHAKKNMEEIREKLKYSDCKLLD